MEKMLIDLSDGQLWYIETGQGILSILNLKVQVNGYTIADIGTHIKYMDNFSGTVFLRVIIKSLAEVKNRHSVLSVNPKNCPNDNIKNAIVF